MSPIRRTPRRGEAARGEDRQRPRGPLSARSVRRWAPRAGLLAGLAVLATGCKSSEFTRLGMPPPVTRQGHLTLSLWQGSWIAAFAVGVVVWGLIIYAVVFHRKRSEGLPAQVRYNLPIEALYTVLPFIMIGVLFYFTARDENKIDALSPHPSVVVDVFAAQWTWSFQYPQYPLGGRAIGCPGTGVCEVGAQWNPNLPDNKQHLPLLEIPANKTVRFNLISLDVDHAFWIVPFLFKRDVIPDHPNHFQVTPTATGTSIGRCSELCGLYHSRMLFTVKIVTPAQFQTWIRGQQALQKAAGGAS